MSVLADIYHGKKKKRFTMCGCLLLPDSEGNICECCLDDMYREDPEEVESY